MSRRQQEDVRRPKKPYVKPEVKRVQLKPEEAVLGGCKVSQANNPNIGGTCSSPTTCYALVS